MRSVIGVSEAVLSPDVDCVAAGAPVAVPDVCFASCEAKKIVIVAGSVCGTSRSIVIGIAGLWYFKRTSSWRQNFLFVMVTLVRDSMLSSVSRLTVPWSHVSSVYFWRKAHVYPRDIFW